MTAALDYETTKIYQFDVSATFSNGVTSHVAVRINVLDVNDVCPTFSSAEYIVQHTEPLNKNLLIASTQVTDPDTTGSLSYSIQQGITFSLFYLSSSLVYVSIG